MLRDINSYDGIYLACGVTDLRKAVDGLATIVKNEFNMNPCAQNSYGPRSRRRLKTSQVSQLRNLMNGMSVDPPRGFGDIKARDFF
jgi:transposase